MRMGQGVRTGLGYGGITCVFFYFYFFIQFPNENQTDRLSEKFSSVLSIYLSHLFLFWLH